METIKLGENEVFIREMTITTDEYKKLLMDSSKLNIIKNQFKIDEGEEKEKNFISSSNYDRTFWILQSIFNDSK